MTEAFIDGLERRVFRAGPESAPLTDEVKSWLVAHEIGFQLPPGTERKHEALAESRRVDNAEFTAVYDRGDANLYGADTPIGTYITYPRTLNAGRDLLPTRLITGIGVRAEYQGRGIVRRVLTDDLARAQRDGVPMAALTATEGGLYARYGFGVASFQKSVEVDVRRAQFRAASVGDGPGGIGVVRARNAWRSTVRQIDRAMFARIAEPVFDRFHTATLGSIGRAAMTPRGMSGEFGFADADLYPSPNRRFAARIDPASGEIDGYVVYSHGGWHGGERVVTAIDLVAATREGYLELWQYLLGQSLTDTVRFDHAPAADVLPWALEDPRAYRVVTERDLLWLRILDVRHALESRRWLVDAVVSIRVEDSVGLIDGVYRVEVRGGVASVSRVAEGDDAEVIVDASALASLYLGGVTVHQLLGSGRIRAAEHVAGGVADGAAEAIETLQRLFASHTTPYTNTVF